MLKPASGLPLSLFTPPLKGLAFPRLPSPSPPPWNSRNWLSHSPINLRQMPRGSKLGGWAPAPLLPPCPAAASLPRLLVQSLVACPIPHKAALAISQSISPLPPHTHPFPCSVVLAGSRGDSMNLEQRVCVFGAPPPPET